jgi:protoporphyrinogen oxidase
MARSGDEAMTIGVIGGGAMGLTAAYELAKSGRSVVLFEGQRELGGMASSFDWNGLRVERYYHFICGPDDVFVNAIRELGLEPRLRWRTTKMSYFYQGRHYRWGDPLSLARFPDLNLAQKFRYGLNVLYSKYTRDWRKLEDVSAETWLKKWLGDHAYDVLWKALLEFKFGDQAGDLSAAWIWSRIRRVANSRKNLFQEEYGYLEGGSEVFFQALANRIEGFGGKIERACPVTGIDIQDGKIRGVRTPRGEFPLDALISTIPLPEFLEIRADLPEPYRRALAEVGNIGIMCALFLLKKPLTDNFWLNIKDPRIEIPGLIEYTNLNPDPAFQGLSLVYIPQYMPETDPRYLQPDSETVGRYFAYLQILNPAFTASDLVDYKIFRNRHAQPVPRMGFSKRLPPIQSPITGLQVADTCFYFPEDRTIDQSIGLGKRLAQGILPGGKGAAV